LTAFANQLMDTVCALSRSLRDVELRLANVYEIETRLTFGLRTRIAVLTFVQARIEGEEPWDATAVRTRLTDEADGLDLWRSHVLRTVFNPRAEQVRGCRSS
jgi:hypothetical protein